ncbi:MULTISPECIES: glycosyltransferase family 4 protein [Actinomadura]|uniref:Glycosyltransferase family 4 protein n=1 Tax=Actinomadura yumaensis TaxID=111807 RepID=A0ABW2CDJ9_9ACTN|nr:glycosyltransferase family 4 protein [Actinomadura sp. J1-007]
MDGTLTGARGTARLIPRTLVVTGHFPPEDGGVQTFTWELVRRLPADRLLVVAPCWPGDAAFDAGLPFPTVRRHGYLLFRGLRRLVREHALTAGWITAAAPFGLYAPLVRAAGVGRLVASSHGQELGWARALPTRLAMRAVAGRVDTLTCLNRTTRAELGAAVGRGTRLATLAGGVDAERFAPHVSGEPARRRYGLGGGPVVVSVARLVRRKGHDLLLRAWADVLAARPDARLLIVGDGPMRGPLAEAAAREFPGSVRIAGPVPAADLPGCYAAADVFVLPCRDDRRGLQTEGLGLTTLEASASGLPVVVGRSGGSAESLLDRRTGLLVDASRPDAIASALLELLADPVRARAMGAAGRRWVLDTWTWDRAAERLAALLRGEPAPDPMIEPWG